VCHDNCRKLYEIITECDDDDDDNEVEDGDESNCQDVSSSVAGVNDSASVSPHVAGINDSASVSSHVAGVNDSAPVSPHPIIDQSDEEPEPELDSSKSKLPKSGLRIKLSLKPVRKSARDHKAHVSV